MATNNTYTVSYRRKREGKTDYKLRRKILLGRKPRLVIRKSLKHVSAQIIEFSPEGDKVVANAHSSQLKKIGWKASTSSIAAGYLTGLLLAKNAKVQNVCVADIGQYSSVPGCVLYAVMKGAIDGGLNVPFSDKILPNEERIKGQHIAAFAKKLKEDKERYSKQFGNYVKNGLDPEILPKHFEEVKAKIGG